MEAVVQVIGPPAIEDEAYFPDGGLRAWLVVIGCSVISAVVVGFWYDLPLQYHVPKSWLTFLQLRECRPNIGWSFTGSQMLHHQIWGVFQAYYAQGILSGTSPSTLSLLGSIPGAVCFRI